MKKQLKKHYLNRSLLWKTLFISICAFTFESIFHSYIPEYSANNAFATLLDSTFIAALTMILSYYLLILPSSHFEESTIGAIITSMSEGVIYQDVAGKIKGHNLRALEILNLNENEILNKLYKDSKWKTIHLDGTPFHPDNHPAMVAIKTGVTQHNIIMGVENSNSPTRWIRITSVPLFLNKKTKKPQGAISTFADITTEIINKKELEKMYERQVLSAKALNLGVWDWNLITDELIWDDKMYEIFEVDKKLKPMTGKYFFNTVVHTDDQKSLGLIVNSTLKNKKQEFHSEFRIKTQTGLEKYIRANAICFYKGDGTPERLIGNNIDITQQVETEEKMNQFRIESEKFFLIGIQPHCIAGLDGYFKRVNPQFLKILGYQEAEVLSKPFIDFVHPDDRADTLLQVQKLSKGISVIDFENRYLDAKGEYRVINWITSPDVETGLLYSAARDVTEEKIQQTKLIQSSKMVTLGEMASGMAHEINNPLAAIQGRADQLIRMMKSENPIEKETLEKHLNTIYKMSDRIAKIVRSLKNFTRKADADPFLPTPVELIINETLDLCSEKIKNYGIKMDVCVDQNLCISARQSQISQVLLNLINNACDAIKSKSEKWIKITCRHDNLNLKLEITDSGNGIPKELQTKIMEPFYTTKNFGTGTGLGLSISKTIMTEHGGNLILDTESKNTRFIMILPIINIQEAAA